MKGLICAAADASTVLGLRLAGAKETVVWTGSDDPAELRDWYRRMVEKGKGAMVLSQDCAKALSRELIEKRTSGVMTPIVVVIPGKEEDQRAKEMMRRAVGLDRAPAPEGGKP